ncbi:AbrB family transcriptional regulator [Sphingomonas desiccabilis]|uniref:AbrB family transcriptional regulator n=1 Tax=Sphingomonas desiccabilis TaxID=429134 RepID=UPI0035D4AC25
MTDAPPPYARCRAASPSIYWGVLIVLSVIFAYVLNLIDIPAALLLGPLIAGIVVAFQGAKLEVPWLGFGIAQGVLGCMIAKTIPHAVVGGALVN